LSQQNNNDDDSDAHKNHPGWPSFSSCIFREMTFNIGMTIWIFAVLLMVSVSLAGWRQGAIRAAFAFVGILFAALLAVPVGHLIHPLLPHLGASDPLVAWVLSPIIGFILASIPLKVAGHYVHHRIEHFYKYNAGDLRMALWQRLNSRLGICIGLMNGAVYFILVSFFIFNITYWTTQTASASSTPPTTIRLLNSLGEGMQSTGFTKTASAIGSLPPTYYSFADLCGLLAQNKDLGARFATYPGLESLWYRGDMQPLVTDATLTNAVASGASLSDVINDPAVQSFLANKQLTKMVGDAVTTNLDDLKGYLKSGKSSKFTDPIIGTWQFNPGVTLAWFRQEQPKMKATEMQAIRALWTQAYGPTTVVVTGDNQVFVKSFPKFEASAQPNQPPFQPEDWSGDWSKDGANYTLHVTLNGQDKYLTGSADGLRLKVKDGHNLLVFDQVD